MATVMGTGFAKLKQKANTLLGDARKAVALYRSQGAAGLVATALLTRSRRTHHDPVVPPESPIAWSETLARIHRHYALGSDSEIVWSETETRRDVRRIVANSTQLNPEASSIPIAITQARQLRQTLATIEALRSWPQTRSQPIEVYREGSSSELWRSLDEIPGVSVIHANSTSKTPAADLPNVVSAITSGQLPLPHWPSHHLEQVAHSTGANKRLLVISPHVPDVRRGSGSIDMYWFAKHAVNLGYDVLYLPTLPKMGDESGRWDLREAGVKVVSGSLESEQLLASLPKAVKQAHIVAVFDKSLTTRVRKIIETTDTPRPLLLFIPLDLKQFPQRVLVEKKLGDSLKKFGFHVPNESYVSHLAEEEVAAIRASDKTALISTAELEALRSTDVSERLLHLPMLRSDLQNVAEVGERPRLLFVGGFTHPPNYLAVGWFLDAIWPTVHERNPELTFEIHGADLSPEWSQRWGGLPGVDIRGPYDKDHEPYVGDVVAVAPLLYGGGTKGKVVGALGHGAVVVGTRFAAEGLPKSMQEVILVADDAPDFVEQLSKVLSDSALRRRLSVAGRQQYEEHFSPSAGRRHVRETLTGLHNQRISC